MKKLLTLIFFIYFSQSVWAQSGGVSIQTGLSYGFTKENALTRPGQGHYGWLVGMDARLLGGDMYFLIGGQYHKTSLFSTEGSQFFKNDMSLVMGRLGMGFTIVKLGYKSYLRTKLLGSINFIIDGPDPKPAFPNSEAPANLNDSFLGATTGLGWTKGIFDIDLEYQHGLLNSVFKQPNSKFSYFSVLFGVNF